MRPSFPTPIAEERKLLGGRVALLALVLVLVACGRNVATDATASSDASPSVAAPSSAPSSSATATQPAIPTLGGPAASGVVLLTYFVTVVESRYGVFGVVTTPGSGCTAEAALPDGSKISSPGLSATRTADAGGRVAFEYPATPAAPGVGIHTVTCELAGQRGQARARFDVK